MLPGKRDFADMTKVTDLKRGRFSWVDQSHEPLKAENILFAVPLPCLLCLPLLRRHLLRPAQFGKGPSKPEGPQLWGREKGSGVLPKQLTSSHVCPVEQAFQRELYCFLKKESSRSLGSISYSTSGTRLLEASPRRPGPGAEIEKTGNE
jgi:hypothetical protein